MDGRNPSTAALVETAAPSHRISIPHADVCTVAEVAVALRCSKAHVHNLIKGKVRGAERLPSIRLGRRRLVRLEGLADWLSRNETQS